MNPVGKGHIKTLEGQRAANWVSQRPQEPLYSSRAKQDLTPVLRAHQRDKPETENFPRYPKPVERCHKEVKTEVRACKGGKQRNKSFSQAPETSKRGPQRGYKSGNL